MPTDRQATKRIAPGPARKRAVEPGTTAAKATAARSTAARSTAADDRLVDERLRDLRHSIAELSASADRLLERLR